MVKTEKKGVNDNLGNLEGSITVAESVRLTVSITGRKRAETCRQRQDRARNRLHDVLWWCGWPPRQPGIFFALPVACLPGSGILAKRCRVSADAPPPPSPVGFFSALVVQEAGVPSR